MWGVPHADGLTAAQSLDRPSLASSESLWPSKTGNLGECGFQCIGNSVWAQKSAQDVREHARILVTFTFIRIFEMAYPMSHKKP